MPLFCCLNYFLQQLVHNTGRKVSVLIAVSVVLAIALSFVIRGLILYRKTLLYIFTAVVLSSVLVGCLKHSLSVSCPWEFQRYGGDLVYTSVIEQLFLRNGDGCFPAGHAITGFALFILFFAFKSRNQKIIAFFSA